ncbi:zinc finger, C2H [Tanacetum coccineum]
MMCSLKVMNFMVTCRKAIGIYEARACIYGCTAFFPTLSFCLLNLAPLFLIQSSEEHAHELHCSRERSRAAYKIIEEYLTPFVERENYQMSAKCKLHPSNDIFRDQEEHKIHVDVNEWRCGYCKKSFRAEKFLDQHFHNRHYNLLNVSQSNCLADLCGALHCDYLANSVVPKTKCNPAAAARNRHLCEMAVFQFIRVPQQVDFMNYFCANSVMPIPVQAASSLLAGEAGEIRKGTQVKLMDYMAGTFQDWEHKLPLQNYLLIHSFQGLHPARECEISIVIIRITTI